MIWCTLRLEDWKQDSRHPNNSKIEFNTNAEDKFKQKTKNCLPQKDSFREHLLSWLSLLSNWTWTEEWKRKQENSTHTIHTKCRQYPHKSSLLLRVKSQQPSFTAKADINPHQCQQYLTNRLKDFWISSEGVVATNFLQANDEPSIKFCKKLDNSDLL